jgi:hypothetical protein
MQKKKNVLRKELLEIYLCYYSSIFGGTEQNIVKYNYVFSDRDSNSGISEHEPGVLAD